MKKVYLIIMIGIFCGLTFAGEKVDVKFSGKALERSIKKRLCVVKENILSISGDTADKNNDWRAVVFPLPFKNPAGKKFTFSGKIKGEKITGEFWVAIRLIKADGTSIKYEVQKITKDQNWKIFMKTFTAPAATATMQFYIIGRKMDDKSIGSVKNLSIEQLD